MPSSLPRTLALSLAALMLTLGACHRKPHDQATTGNTSAAKPGAKPPAAVELKVTDQPPFKLSTDGLLMIDPQSGTSNLLAFGSEQFDTTRQIGKAIGNFTGQAENPDCAAGQLASFDYPGGLTLFFQDKKFVGWDFDGQGGFATPNDIGIGSTLGDLRETGEVALRDSSVGHEFAAGELHGLVDASTPKGKVTDLWAGTTCIAR
jgi:hypothetical protein